VIGTAFREALTLTIPTVAGVPVVTLGINVVGAFFLGVLLETLLRHGNAENVRRVERLFFGTGMLGGFTTYSALATEAALLIGADRPSMSVAYLTGTVVLGAVATWAGIAWAAGRNKRKTVSKSVAMRADD